jgi:hypothetical protein
METRFVPEMITGKDHAAHLHDTGQEADMTALLIALAVAGLVALAVWEALR